MFRLRLLSVLYTFDIPQKIDDVRDFQTSRLIMCERSIHEVIQSQRYTHSIDNQRRTR